MTRTIAVLLTVFLALQATAQDVEPVEELREFNVEVIIFAYAQDVSVGTEIFVPDELPPIEPVSKDDSLGLDNVDDSLGKELQPESIEQTPETDENGPEDDGIPDFSILTGADLQMQDIASRMRRLDVYEVLLHAGWTQAARPKEASFAMRLNMLAPLPQELSGEFTLYLSRFLHLVADLELDAPGNNAMPVAIEPPADMAFDRVAAPIGPTHYRIKEDRIFRSDETRYYDHPKFGIVARVTRYEPPVVEEIEFLDESPELLPSN